MEGEETTTTKKSACVYLPKASAYKLLIGYSRDPHQSVRWSQKQVGWLISGEWVCPCQSREKLRLPALFLQHPAPPASFCTLSAHQAPILCPSGPLKPAGHFGEMKNSFTLSPQKHLVTGNTGCHRSCRNLTREGSNTCRERARRALCWLHYYSHKNYTDCFCRKEVGCCSQRQQLCFLPVQAYVHFWHCWFKAFCCDGSVGKSLNHSFYDAIKF